MFANDRLTTHVIRGLMATILTLLIAAGVGLAILHLHGEKLLSVQTASMVPTFQPGDALIVAPVTYQKLRVGEIISYRNPRNPNITISHRIIAINERTGWLTTAGDARKSPDQTFPPDLLIGQATALAPRLGILLDLLHKPIGLAITIYLPATLVILFEINRLSNFYARPAYSVRL